LRPAETNDQELAVRYELQAFAIGDSCLLHLRDGQPLYWFPLDTSAEFGLNPAVMASVNRQADHLLEFKVRSQECLPGDLLVLATDAIALWAIERSESGETIDWTRYWDYSDDEWRQEIFALRDAKLMRFDDSTLVLLRVVEEQPAPIAPPEETAKPDLLMLPEEALAEDALIQQEPFCEERVEAATLAEAAVLQSTDLDELVRPDEISRFDAVVEEGIEKLEETAVNDDGELGPKMGDERPTSQPTEG
jgi:hypothetical protein